MGKMSNKISKTSIGSGGGKCGNETRDCLKMLNDKKYTILRFSLLCNIKDTENTLYFAYPLYYYHHRGEAFNPAKLRTMKEKKMTLSICIRSAKQRGYLIQDCTPDSSFFHVKECIWCGKPIDTRNKRRPAYCCSVECKRKAEHFLETWPNRYRQIEKYVPTAPLIECLKEHGLYHEGNINFPIDKEYALSFLSGCVRDLCSLGAIDDFSRILVLEFRKCEVCRKHIPIEKPIQSRFCSDECRKHASYIDSKKEREKKEDN